MKYVCYFMTHCFFKKKLYFLSRCICCMPLLGNSLAQKLDMDLRPFDLVAEVTKIQT